MSPSIGCPMRLCHLFWRPALVARSLCPGPKRVRPGGLGITAPHRSLCPKSRTCNRKQAHYGVQRVSDDNDNDSFELAEKNGGQDGPEYENCDPE